MAKVCDCDAGLGNLGLPNCAPKFGIARKLLFVNRKDSTGALNSIDSSVTIDSTVITTNVNNTDRSQRWYLSPEIKNLTNERSESEYETFDDGSNSFIRKGIRSLTGLFVEKDTVFLNNLDANECVDLAVYFISDKGGLMGKFINGDTTNLYPISIKKFDTNWMPQTDTTAEKVTFSFDFSTLERDCDVRFIDGADITGDLLGSEGLINVTGSYSGITTTAATVTMTNEYGSFGNLLKHTGVLTGAVTLQNLGATGLGTPATVVHSAWTETSNGVYSFTFPAQTTGDVMRILASKNGFDYNKLLGVTFLAL